MSLRVLAEPPPCYGEIIEAFPFARQPGTYFTYGRCIFIPAGRLHVSDHMQVHETVHADRQGNDPAGWWRRYLQDQEFRLAEELAAHQAEFQFFDGRPRRERQFYLRQAAHRLSSPLYRLGITSHKAKQLITGRQNPDL